jgi:uncharacterized integral membrane protein
VLRQLLLLPLLAPLLAVMVVGALNPKPSVRLRLLTTTSPPLPIGVWIMLAATGGGLLSAAAAGLALRSGSSPGRQRQVRLPLGEEPPWSEPSLWADADSINATTPSRRRSPPPPTSERDWPETMAAGPSRAPGEPAPTVEVPFRVIRRPASPTPATASGVASSPAEDDWDRNDSDW